jgi:signal transduction histidine kinase
MDGPKQQNFTPRAPGRSLPSALHEINNPLESLLNLLYLVEADPAISQASRGHLKMAQGEVMRVSKIAQSAMKRVPRREAAEETDIGALLTSVVELHQSKLARHGVFASTQNDDDAKAIIYPEQMRQVFSNLLLNAIDAMPQGGKIRAKISKTQEWTGEGRSGLRITIADTGVGIPPDTISRICEPFFTTKGAYGNGMGLAVVQEIVAYHQGRLKVRSSTKSGKSGAYSRSSFQRGEDVPEISYCSNIIRADAGGRR